MIVIITACLNYSECESGGEFDVVHCADDDERDVQMRLYGPMIALFDTALFKKMNILFE